MAAKLLPFGYGVSTIDIQWYEPPIARLMVYQASSGIRPHDVQWGSRIWSARALGSDDRYVALFHPGDKLNPKREPRGVAFSLDQLGRNGPVTVRDLWLSRDPGRMTGRMAATLPVHGAALYRVRG